MIMTVARPSPTSSASATGRKLPYDQSIYQRDRRRCRAPPKFSMSRTSRWHAAQLAGFVRPAGPGGCRKVVRQDDTGGQGIQRHPAPPYHVHDGRSRTISHASRSVHRQGIERIRRPLKNMSNMSFTWSKGKECANQLETWSARRWANRARVVLFRRMVHSLRKPEPTCAQQPEIMTAESPRVADQSPLPP